MNIVRWWNDPTIPCSPLPDAISSDTTCASIFKSPCIRYDAEPETREWFARRQDGDRLRIGGSTAAALLGLHKYKSASEAVIERLCLYDSSVSNAKLADPWPPFNRMQRGFMNLGQAGEPRTRSWLRTQGLDVHAPVHVSMGPDDRDLDWLAVTTDGMTLGIDGSRIRPHIPLECKFMPSRHSNPDHEVFPLMYAVQVHLQICLLGANWGHFVVTSWDTGAPSMMPNPDLADLTQYPDDVWDMKCYLARAVQRDDALHKNLLFALSIQHGHLKALSAAAKRSSVYMDVRRLVLQLRENMDRGRVHPMDFGKQLTTRVMEETRLAEDLAVFQRRADYFSECLAPWVQQTVRRAHPIDMTWEGASFQENARLDDDLPTFPFRAP